MTIEAEILPDLPARWMRELLGEDIPRESRATCAQCAMCAPPETPATASQRFFDPEVKCCSYYPILPNFLVGRALAGDDAVGRASVAARIEAKLEVTPLGLGQPAAYAALYEKAHEAFGVSKKLRCPHYVEESGGCGIWRHRNAVCATWFCKFVRGEAGSAFWNTVHRLLEALELALARHCVLELDLGSDALTALIRHPAWSSGSEPLSASQLDGLTDHGSGEDLWGRWRAKERQYFVRAGELVADLSWDEALAIGGSEVRGLALSARAQFAALKRADIPERLTLAPFAVVSSSPVMLRLRTYSDYDPLDIPPVLFEALRFFTGGSNSEAEAAVLKELGARLEPELLRKLVDFGLLKPATHAPRP